MTAPGYHSLGGPTAFMSAPPEPVKCTCLKGRWDPQCKVHPPTKAPEKA